MNTLHPVILFQMTFHNPSNSEFDDDEALQRQYMASAIQFKFKMPAITNNLNLSYYTVSDIDIRYRCACFGHASQCDGAVSN